MAGIVRLMDLVKEPRTRSRQSIIVCIAYANFKKKCSRAGEKTADFSERCFCEDHEIVCDEYINLIETFAAMEKMLDEMGNKWLKHKYIQAVHDVLQLKMHLLRAVHQDRAKTDLYGQLSDKRALIIFDFAMKFLPQKYREAQVDFFGKKGDLILV